MRKKDENLFFSRNLSLLMKRNNLTLQELGEKLGVTRQAISAYCSGKALPSYTMLLNIAKFFNTSTDFLITGKNPENKSARELLNLSDLAINSLKNCPEKILPYIDKLLSDPDFYMNFIEAVRIFQENSNAAINLIKNNLVAIDENPNINKLTFLENLLHTAIISSDTHMRNYFLEFFRKNTSFYDAKKLLEKLD